MQFIQLQPQIAAQVPTPAAGNVNFFVDVNNNAVSLMDDTGQPVTVGSGGYTPVTYSELVEKITGETLTQGAFYLITDFRTCYDQPDFDSNRSAIIGGNYKEADIDPIIVFALSSNTLSTVAYQPSYPKDKIQYDWTFSATERTNGVAYGRITERIDEFNNRTDYDHRTIQFKRYEYIEMNVSNPHNGTVNVSVTGGTGMLVTGTSTSFQSLSVGQYVGFQFDAFKAYEITSIVSDTEMYISGLTTTSLSGVKMYLGSTFSDVSYYQNNITTAYTEYYTFNYQNNVINNYIGDFANLYGWNQNDFLLANNVFIGGSYTNNTFGHSCYNNTFDDDCSNNIIGNWFYNNITDDDFDANVIGNWFTNNKITSNFQYNRIGENFEENYLVQNSFYRNNIMNYFQNNIVDGSDFQNNEIGSQFGNNEILFGQFYKNDIGNGFNNNNVYSNFYGNIIGNGFNNNNVYCSFYENTIGEVFEDNNLGDPLSFGSFDFNDNKIGNAFQNNTCLGTFAYNLIGSNFTNNTVGDGFGYGYNTSQGNVIGNYFYSNTIGEYFYNNTIVDGFYNNQVFDYFQLNSIKTPVFGIDFTQYYTNISAFTYTANGTTATGNTYTNLTGSTNGAGVGATFDIVVSGGSVVSVSGNTQGKYYDVNDTITILGSQIGGTDGNDDVVITVTGTSPVPTVYEAYNCDIFKNAANVDRLSFYDASDVITIKNINE